MPEVRICPDCGAALPGNSPSGFCPECLMRAGTMEETQVSKLPGRAADSISSGHPFAVRRFADYELLEEIAHGGMGIVYKARQVSLDRTVAVKMLLFGALASQETVQRFRIEAAAAASLQHPNIVAIYEVGFHDSQHFFAMEYVAGRSLADVVRDGPLAPRRAAAYLKAIAEAIHYAHERGILHRDLKPSNVLIDAFDQPKVTDFGLAKRLETEIELTLSGQLLGSPNYMPPEQAAAKRGAVGKRSDVYALGAILYHLLTGRPPFVAPTVAETLQEVLNTEPVPPRVLNPGVPLDLDTICLKCLEKDPTKRYQTAALLAEELDHFLKDEPIRARAVTRVERGWRWCRRKPLVAGLAAGLVLVFTAGLLGVVTEWRREKNKSEENRRQVANLNVLSGVELMQEGDYFKSLLWFTEALRTDAGHPEQEELHRIRIASVLQQAPRLVQVITHEGLPIAAASFNGADDRLATVADQDRTVRVWDIPSGKLLTKSERLAHVPYNVLFSPDGTRLLVVLSDNTVLLLDAGTAQPIGKPLPHQLKGAGISALQPAFDPSGQRVITQPKEKELQLWFARTGELLGPPLRHTNQIEGFQFGAGGAILFTRTDHPSNFVWDTETGQRLSLLGEGAEAIASVFAAPANDLVLVNGRIGRLNPKAPKTGPAPSDPSIKEQGLTWGAFSPEGGRVVTASRRSARIWDALSGEPLTAPLPHLQTVSRAAFSPDGHRVLTVSGDSLSRVWDADSGEPLTPPVPHAVSSGSSAFSGSGRYWVTMHPRFVACVWDLHREGTPPALLKPLSWNPSMNEAAANGGTLMTQGAENLIRLRQASGPGVPLHSLSLKTIPIQAWFDESSRFVLLEGEFAKVQVWEASAGNPDFSGMPLTPLVQSHYALDDLAAKQVNLPTIDWPLEDLIELAQLLAGSKLDGKQGWTLLEPEDLQSRWEHLAAKVASGTSDAQSRPGSTEPAVRILRHAILGPGAASLAAWHRGEAAAAEKAADWWGADFHWRQLRALEPMSTELAQRLHYSSNCAARAETSARTYHERRRLQAPRDPQASDHQINLTPHFTAPITDELSDARRDVGLQIGLQTLGGVIFDVRGLVQLNSRSAELWQQKRPESVKAIQIHQRAARIHLLHTEQWANTETNEAIAVLTFRYANGQQERLSIQHGIQVGADDDGGPADVKQAQIVSIVARPYSSPPSVRLYKYSWPNPHPDWDIAQMDIESTRTKASYVLLAITTE
jgi:WD40 repeat protein